jgi:hypothetical protein
MLDTDARAKLRSLLPQVLARRLNEAGAEPGTNAYCLHVYLLQKLYLVPLGYRFKLYPEGPQCDEVLGDLDLAKSRNEVQIDYIQENGAIRILPGLRFHERPETESPLVHYAQQLDELIATFGNCNARELDLRAAIISIWSLTRPSDKESAEEALDLVRVLKPHREESEIRAAMDELRSNGSISMDLPGNQAGT